MSKLQKVLAALSLLTVMAGPASVMVSDISPKAALIISTVGGIAAGVTRPLQDLGKSESK